MKEMLLNDLRRVVTLFTGFVIGMHGAVLLHEFGHALGFWFSGGTVSRIVMQASLPAGRVEGHGPNESAYLWVWGGVVFGSIMTPALLGIARRFGHCSPFRFAMWVMAAFCLGHNGMYLFVGSMIPFADASGMIGLGAPRWLLFVLGLPLMVGFLVVLMGAISMIDLSPEDSLLHRVLVVELGLLSFPAVMVASMYFMPVPPSVRSPTLAFVSCYALCFAIAAGCARAVSSVGDTDRESAHMKPKWSTPGALMLAAVVFVFIEWLAFGAA